MLSSNLNYHHYSPPFGHYPNPNGLSHELQQQQQHQHHALALDTLADGSEYALHELQQQQQQQQHQHQQQQSQHHTYQPSLGDGKLMLKHRHHPYRSNSYTGIGRHQKDPSGPERSSRTSSGGGPVRRRISRACDQCNQLRTKCDGKTPCAHCVEFGLTCEYIRERKKRGKASRKDIAKQQAAAAAAAAGQDTGRGSPDSAQEQSSDEQNLPSGHLDDSQQLDVGQEQSSALVRSQSLRQSRPPLDDAESIYSHLGSISSAHGLGHGQDNPGQGNGSGQNNESALSLPTPRGLLDLNDYASMDEYQHSLISTNSQHPTHVQVTNLAQHIAAANGLQQFGEGSYSVLSPPTSAHTLPNPFRMAATDSIPGSYLGQSPVAASPSWLSIPSPTAAIYQQTQNALGSQTLRYPVLRPLLPYLGSVMPVSLACDLLELYFTSPTSFYMRPESPYLLGYVFRKRSFLRQNNPRRSSPALLASMLWVAAQTSESQFLTSPPSMRGKICKRLLELTICLLKPLVHNPTETGTPAHDSGAVINGLALGGFGQVSLGGFGVVTPNSAPESDMATPGASAGLDDVATYVHLATVVSASEYKAASLRWWNAAWSLARELKLGRELPPNPPDSAPQNDMDADGDLDGDVLGSGNQDMRSTQAGQKPSSPGYYSEEEREERRRIWWLVYSVDRHLSLCYNKPLFLLDRECDGLFQPIDDTLWQAGEVYTGAPAPSTRDFDHPQFSRRRGPHFECSGHSIFGYFLPLMTILGEIVDLNHARNHPRFGLSFRSNSAEWDHAAAEITQQLEAYGRSLKEFEARYVAAVNDSVAHATAAVNAAAAAQPDTAAGAGGAGGAGTGAAGENSVATPSAHSVSTTARPSEALIQSRIVLAYATHLMHTLHILLNGKWDPIALLDDTDLWISSASFVSATGHAVAAAEALAEILEHDPDLGFMPFFFGIYLLQGSFLLLLIADKLKEEVGEGVVRACETIVRAHEACVVTLNTEYQRNFRKVMRSALAQVKGRLPEDYGEQQLRRRETLALYRWTGDGSGLAL
ncbi:MAG: hypothetical protein M1822_007426 [Bathelium mastoideum]|nr:MAG: hypothetical protein M1822_007426 [Bathelium mastoideum]